jgi:hypothetical protein
MTPLIAKRLRCVGDSGAVSLILVTSSATDFNNQHLNGLLFIYA